VQRAPRRGDIILSPHGRPRPTIFAVVKVMEGTSNGGQECPPSLGPLDTPKERRYIPSNGCASNGGQECPPSLGPLGTPRERRYP
jgi:hypothetical protein